MPINFKSLDSEVKAGLKNEKDRMRDAYDNLRFYNTCFDEYSDGDGRGGVRVARSDRWDADRPTGVGGPSYDRMDFSLGLPVMRRIVDVLTGNLYKKAPTRELPSPEATAWLNRVYRRNGMAGRWQRADALSVVGGFSAFQFAGDTDPESPVKVNLWGADQLAVWLDPDDQLQPAAVAAIDKYDGSARLSLWTEETVAYYQLKKGGPYAGDGSRAWEFVKKSDNPYRMPATADDQGRGIIPFSFVHFTQPTQEFETNSPGNRLRELNDYLNFGFNELGDGVRYLSRPIGLAEGVDDGWDPPAIVKPGMFLKLPPSSVDAGGNGPTPTLRWLAPELQFVAIVWSHLNSYLDLALELNGIPPSTIRMVLEARSGISILAEQAPLLAWAESRRRPFTDYETAAAMTALRIGAAHRRNNGRDARMLDEAADAQELSLAWPRMYVELPGPERDRQDGVRVASGQASLVDLVQERDDLTREQALKKLQRVKEDNELLVKLGINPLPAVFASGQPGSPGAAQSGGQEGGGDFAPQVTSNEATGNDVQSQADAVSGEGG